MKRSMMLALAIACLTVACGGAEAMTDGDDTPKTPEMPSLNALWVKTADETFYATIDQSAGTARIGTLAYVNRIREAGYALGHPGTTISPDPKDLTGKWQREQTVTVSLDGRQKTYTILFPDYKEPADDPGNPDDDGIDYDYSPGFAPRDDEKQVYARPGIPVTAASMPKGSPHPNAALAAAGWKLFTVNEFSDGVEVVNGKGETVKLPHGLYPHNTATMNESAVVRNDECSRVEDGRLIMEAFRLPETVNTGFTNTYNPTGEVDYKHASYRTYPITNAQYGDWFTFAPNMRVEVRFRRTNTIGFNNAIWFQGNVKLPWPAYGEIDLLENPKKEINYTMHSTLHSQHFNSGGPKDEHVGPSISSTTTLADMTRWNIYWIELYPDRVVCGVNGEQVFSYSKGDKVKNDNGAMVDNPDWPWDQAEGFYMILSTGMNDKRSNGWQGMVRASDFSESNPPTMEFDWIRVYVNEAYDRSQAKNIFY